MVGHSPQHLAVDIRSYDGSKKDYGQDRDMEVHEMDSCTIKKYVIQS